MTVDYNSNVNRRGRWIPYALVPVAIGGVLLGLSYLRDLFDDKQIPVAIEFVTYPQPDVQKSDMIKIDGVAMAVVQKPIPLPKTSRYHLLPEKKKKIIKKLLKYKNDSSALMRISRQIMRDSGCGESQIDLYTSCGMCAAYAQIVSRYFGNMVPLGSGHAWTMFRNNPVFRKFQIYPDDINNWSAAELNNGEGPNVLDYQPGRPNLGTGDVVSMPMGGGKYVYHVGVVILDPFDVTRKYLLEAREAVRMNNIIDGVVDIIAQDVRIGEFPMKKEDGTYELVTVTIPFQYTVPIPVAEVIGNPDKHNKDFKKSKRKTSRKSK
ncbi:MAG: hypothetical protein V1870_03590 [Candidatus Aenigmatarchaeota archaeon]